MIVHLLVALLYRISFLLSLVSVVTKIKCLWISFLSQIKVEDYKETEYILVDPSCSGSGITNRLSYHSVSILFQQRKMIIVAQLENNFTKCLSLRYDYIILCSVQFRRKSMKKD